MGTSRKKHSSSFKVKIAIEALKERESLQELSARFEVSQSQISKWKKSFLERSQNIFDSPEPKSASGIDNVDITELYAKIGKLEMENDFIKKLKQVGVMNKKAMIDKTSKLSVRQHCEILDISRSSLYYKPLGESKENLQLMCMLDEHFMHHPTYGVLQMQDYLQSEGYNINEKRVRRLLRKIGIMAIFQKKNISKMLHREYVHPYLLKGLSITCSNQVWK
jgi:putative transposase